MALDSLQSSLAKRSIPDTVTRQQIDTVSRQRIDIAELDAQIACNVVNHMFTYINQCIQNDKSRIKLNMLTKSFIRGLLNDRVREGMNDFIRNMYEDEIRNLLNDIQKELNKRRK